MPVDLQDIRNSIDAVDHELLGLLAKRNAFVSEIAAHKRENRIGIRDLDRERALLLDRACRSQVLGLSPDVVRSLFQLILWSSRDRQAALQTELPIDEPSKTIAVVGGEGAMGSLLVRLFGELGHEVISADLATSTSPIEAAKRAEVVIVSVPIASTVEVIRQIGPCVREDGLLMDVTSVKRKPVEAMVSCSNAAVIGTHPLFGPNVHSLQGQRIVVTPAGPAVESREPGVGGQKSDAGSSVQWERWLERMLRARGLKITWTTPEEHDRMMGIVQVLTHFSTEVMGRTLARLGVPIEQTLEFTSPVYMMELLMTARHFAQSPELYAAIQMENPETQRVLRTFLRSTCEMSGAIDQGDKEMFRRMFEEVRGYIGEFGEKALIESSYLIDRLVERM